MVALRRRLGRRSNRSSVTSSGSGEAGTITALSESAAPIHRGSLRLSNLTGGLRLRGSSTVGNGPAASSSGPGAGASIAGVSLTATGLRKKRHSMMLRNSSMSSVSLDDLASFSDTPATIRTTSNTHELTSAGVATNSSLASNLSPPYASSSLSRRARVAKSAVLSLTIEHSRLLAMLASVESMVQSASTTSSTPNHPHLTQPEHLSPQSHVQPHLPMEEPTHVQQLAVIYERQTDACHRS